MKKSRLIATALATTIMLGSVQLHGAKALSIKEKATKQLDESITRFQKCAKLKCTRGEALKAARDVLIAVGTTLLITHGVGTRLKKTGVRHPIYFEKDFEEGFTGMYKLGATLTKPADTLRLLSIKRRFPIGSYTKENPMFPVLLDKKPSFKVIGHIIHPGLGTPGLILEHKTGEKLIMDALYFSPKDEKETL